jgi:hypothetical protein
LIQFDGYGTKGTPYSDPLLYITASSTSSLVLTADTSCTLSGAANAFQDGIDMIAAGNAGRGISWRTAGAWASSWVTA